MEELLTRVPFLRQLTETKPVVQPKTKGLALYELLRL